MSFYLKPEKFTKIVVIAALLRSFLNPNSDRYPNRKPGDMIERLKPEARKALEGLTSAEIKNDFYPLPSLASIYGQSW